MGDQVHYIMCESNARDTGIYPDPNSYRLHLQAPIREIRRIELVNLKIPNVKFSIDDNVNLLSVSSVSLRTSMKTFTIPRGLYSPDELASELTNALLNLTGMTVVWRGDIGKFLFYRSATFSDFDVQINTVELQKIMGFTDGEKRTSYEVPSQPISDSIFNLYSNNAGYVGNKILFSDTLGNPDLNGYIYLDIEELRNARVDCAGKLMPGGQVDATAGARCSFAPILMDVASGGYKYFYEKSNNVMAIDFQPNLARLDRLTVTWRSNTGELIDFNGRDSASFMLRIISNKC